MVYLRAEAQNGHKRVFLLCDHEEKSASPASSVSAPFWWKAKKIFKNVILSWKSILQSAGNNCGLGKKETKKKKSMFCFGSQSNFVLNHRDRNKKLQLFSSASTNVCLTNAARLFPPTASTTPTVHQTWRWLYLPLLKCDCQFCNTLSDTLPANDNMCS